MYGDGDFAKELNLGAEEIRAAIKDGKKPDDPWTAAASVADRWLAVGRMAETSAQKDVLDFYDLRNSLATITGDGKAGIVGLGLEDGSVLFATDSGLVGRYCRRHPRFRRLGPRCRYSGRHRDGL